MSVLQDVISCQDCQQLVECLSPHVRGEEGHDGGRVGAEAEEAEAGEEDPLTPVLVLLPDLTLDHNINNSLNLLLRTEQVQKSSSCC